MVHLIYFEDFWRTAAPGPWLESNRSNRTGSKQPVRLAQKYAFSDKFKNMFAEGMALVEESAAFLDGPGREAVKDLDRATSLIYDTQSMRLTTRLMQLASWLLLAEFCLSQASFGRRILK